MTKFSRGGPKLPVVGNNLGNVKSLTSNVKGLASNVKRLAKSPTR